MLASEKASLPILRQLLIEWFDSHQRPFPWRSSSCTTFEKVVTEVLLQRTKAEAVARIYPYFFSKYQNWDSIAEADIVEIQEVIRPLGIWEVRSDVLKKLSSEIIAVQGVLPSARADIEKLTGVGQYVANAIELLVFGRNAPLLDSNMARVMERIFRPRKLADIRYDPWLQSICKEVVASERSVQLNWAILDLGALVCRPRNPRCYECPLSVACNFNNNRPRG